MTVSPQTLFLAFCHLFSTPNALDCQDVVLAVVKGELFIVYPEHTILFPDALPSVYFLSTLSLSILYHFSKLRKALIIKAER